MSEKTGVTHRWVHSFGKADFTNRKLLGGKGANLVEMRSIGLPVPPGFTVTTEACREYIRLGRTSPQGLMDEVLYSIRELEVESGQRLGDPGNPLLLSVRSGAVVSMPGMMETILNLGTNESVAEGIARTTGNERFAIDLYRRFIQMFSSVVLGIDSGKFDAVTEKARRKASLRHASELDADVLRGVVLEFKAIVKDESGQEVPDDPVEQLERSIRAVFDSWNTRRAISYRNIHGISHDLGTAVNVMAMVFGNLDNDSCTGVLFTRNPSTGANGLYGEYLINAQGEDVVSGGATPHDINYLSQEMPHAYKQLLIVSDQLERHYGDVQDVEFTVEQGKLYILQTRTGKRSAKAAVKIAVDMTNEGTITKDEAIKRIDLEQISQLLLPRLDESAKAKAEREGRLIATGLSASPGGAHGRVVFDADSVVEMSIKGIDVILTRSETSADDVHGMAAAAGILTTRGGVTSHAAVVARGMGKPCITGADGIEVSEELRTIRIGNLEMREGDQVSIDGSSGEVFVGEIATIQPHISEEDELNTLLRWADSFRRMGVRANADNAKDAKTAIEFGADGVGLCRTEHMFFEPDRLELVREMILQANANADRQEGWEPTTEYRQILDRLEEFQTSDFEGIFRESHGLPVVVRLLDPPLHEFLPDHDELLVEVIELRLKGCDPEVLKAKEALMAAVNDLRETNPMLGLRGCRLGLIFPEIYEMQVRAILKAAHAVKSEGLPIQPEIMVPLVGLSTELKVVRERIEKTITEFQNERMTEVEIKFGVMIELPRAALTADEIAEHAEFFSFGTNDLTQTTFGMSRDDAEGEFLRQYVQSNILQHDPFQVVDVKGVGKLVQIACEAGKRARPELELGVCGEHGGDPSSVEFFNSIGIDYVSCSPYRVPIARLSAAQASLNER